MTDLTVLSKKWNGSTNTSQLPSQKYKLFGTCLCFFHTEPSLLFPVSLFWIFLSAGRRQKILEVKKQPNKTEKVATKHCFSLTLLLC